MRHVDRCAVSRCCAAIRLVMLLPCHPPGSTIPLVSVFRALRNALNSSGAPDEISCGVWVPGTVKELYRLGYTSELGDVDDFCVEWEGLAKGDPLKLAILEAYEKLLRLGYIIPRSRLPDDPYRYRITEKSKRWAQSDGPVPNWGN